MYPILNSLNDLNNIVIQITTFMEELAILEQEKLNAITQKKLTALDDCMKKQQAQILKLRGLDKKREQIQADLGFANISYKEILTKLNGSEEQIAITLFNTLQESTDAFYALNSITKAALNDNLYRVNKNASTTTLKSGTVFKNSMV